MKRRYWNYVAAGLWGVISFTNIVWATQAYTAAGRVWLGALALLASYFSMSAWHKARRVEK